MMPNAAGAFSATSCEPDHPLSTVTRLLKKI
jgi:hypothetical protein